MSEISTFEIMEDEEESFIDPETGWDIRIIKFMKESIDVANTINPSSWAILRGPGYLTFLVQNYAMVLHEGSDCGIAFSGRENTDLLEQLEGSNPGNEYKLLDASFIRSITGDQLAALKPEALARHHELIEKLARGTRTRSAGATRHKADALDEIARIAGATRQPAYLPEIGQEAFSREDQSWCSAMTERMVNSILLANNNNPGSWSIIRTQTSPHQPFLNIGGVNVCKLASNAYQLLVKADHHDVELNALIAEYDSGRTYSHRNMDGMSLLEFGKDDVKGILELANQAHEEAVFSLSQWKSPRANEHRPELLDTLRTLTDELLPHPIYSGIHDGEIIPSMSFPPLVDSSVDDVISSQFAAAGLTYTAPQIATFYTALQTKGFVVLSGISGTGKSKIAQGFVEMLPHPQRGTAPASTVPDSVIAVTVQPYMKRHRRVTIPRSALKLLPESTDRSPIRVSISVNGTSGTGSLAFLSPSGTDDDRVLYFHREIAEEIAKLPVGQPLMLMPVYSDADPMILDAIDIFTDVSQIPSEDRDGATPESLSNNLFLAVRPDWRDSTSLLGYYNPLTKTYEWTEFLRFLIRAQDSYEANDGLAWFVILDEMNLAHVEYYFADLLSIIESGRDERGYSREPLRFSYPDAVENTPPPAELHLPPNLYIIGTVNMDETTHAFSPKVLDRAFTIELTDVDFREYPPAPAPAGDAMSEDEKQVLLAAFTRDGRFAQVNKAEIASIIEHHEEIRTWLQGLNSLLQHDRFHFGYRVFDEIAQFVFNADDNGMFDRWQDAFEHAVFMKVLPKFNGSRARLRSPLFSLVAWAIAPDAPGVDHLRGQFQSALAEGREDFDSLTDTARFPIIAERGIQMLKRLEEDGFVSFG